MRKKIRDKDLVALRNIILEDFGSNYAKTSIEFFDNMQKIHPNLDNFLRDLVDKTIDVFVDFNKERLTNEINEKQKILSKLIVKEVRGKADG